MEQSDIANIKLTVSQENVLRQIIDFVESSTERVFILKGYAGTGKTTLMRFLIKELTEKDKHYRLLASTGRAAKVLANLSESNGETSTIHSMVYSFNGLNKEVEEKEELTSDKMGQLYLVFEPSHLDAKAGPDMVYIVDEASMVSDVVCSGELCHVLFTLSLLGDQCSCQYFLYAVAQIDVRTDRRRGNKGACSVCGEDYREIKTGF